MSTTPGTNAPIHAAAPPPSRATASLTVALGMVTIPVNVFSGVEATTSGRQRFTTSGHPVGNRPYDKVTGENVDNAEVVSKATASDGTLVELSDDEIATVTGGRDGLATIERFIPLESLVDGTYVTDGAHQLRPARMTVGKAKLPNPAAAKALSLLLAGMAAKNVAALVKVALRSQARYAAILPDGRLLIVAFAEQVRAALPMPATDLADNELALVGALIDSVGIGSPPLNDTVSAALQAFVDDKAAGLAPTVGGPTNAKPAESDLMTALTASLAAVAPVKAARKARKPRSVQSPLMAGLTEAS